MHRWLLVLLLVLVPVQFSWATLAAYCGHEATAASQPGGHHDQLESPEARDDLASKSVGGLDLHGSHCHGHCAGMLPAFAHPMADALSARPYAAQPSPAPAHAPAPPERPKWAALA